MKYITSIGTLIVPDDNPDTSYLEQEWFLDRLAEYNSGGFSYVGVYARATIVVNGVSQAITTPGLWGIESDSDESYFEEIAQEETAVLVDQLLELGFTNEEIGVTV